MCKTKTNLMVVTPKIFRATPQATPIHKSYIYTFNNINKLVPGGWTDTRAPKLVRLPAARARQRQVQAVCKRAEHAPAMHVHDWRTSVRRIYAR